MAGEKQVLKIAMIYGHETGVEYYRLLQPAKWLNRMSLCEVRTYSLAEKMSILRSGRKQEDEICLEDIGEWADIFVSARVGTLEQLSMLGGLKTTYKKPVVYELDDDVTCLDRDHPGYRDLRNKSVPEFTERIRIKRSNIDDYARRYRILDRASIDGHADEMMILVMKELDAEWIAKEQAVHATAMTVTTESIRQSYLPHNKEIYILKNCVDFELWDKLQPATPNDKVRIGWAGGMQHRKDIDIIVPVMEKIFDKYPNVEFHHSPTMSDKMKDLTRYHKDRIKCYQWVQVKDWPETYAGYNFDIALAPVVSTNFNKGKSNLKWLENSARKIPTVASRWDTYSNIKDGETGFLAETRDEWIEGISRLVESAELRKQIGNNAYDDVKKNYNARNNAMEYNRVYNEIYDNHKGDEYGSVNWTNGAEVNTETAELGITT